MKPRMEIGSYGVFELMTRFLVSLFIFYAHEIRYICSAIFLFAL